MKTMNLMGNKGTRAAIVLIALAAAGEARADARLLAPLVQGSSVYSVRDLAADISSCVGNTASASLSDQLRTAISKRYVRDGYLTPIVTIPAEDVRSPTPRVYVFEAKIVDVLLKGNAGPYRAQILSALGQLRRSALRKDSLRETLLHISELPGITAKAIFEPQTGMPNEFVAIINASYVPVSGEIDVNNAGTSQLGNALYAGSLFLNDLLGLREQVQLRAATSSEFDRYQFADARIQAPVGGFEMFLEGEHSEAVPDPNVHFGDHNATFGFERAVTAIASGTLRLVAWVHADDDEIHDAANVHLTDDQIRSAAAGLEYSDPRSSTGLSAYSTVVHGTKLLDADSLNAASSEVQVAFTKFLIGGGRSAAFGPDWLARINFDAQVTSDVLPIVERFAFGGLGLGEAFDPASLVGDSGATGGLELGRVLPLHINALQSATVFAKADYGITWNNASYLPRRDEAASMSLGVLGKWPHATLSVELCTPVLQPTYSPRASPVRALATASLAF